MCFSYFIDQCEVLFLCKSKGIACWVSCCLHVLMPLKYPLRYVMLFVFSLYWWDSRGTEDLYDLPRITSNKQISLDSNSSSRECDRKSLCCDFLQSQDSGTRCSSSATYYHGDFILKTKHLCHLCVWPCDFLIGTQTGPMDSETALLTEMALYVVFIY